MNLNRTAVGHPRLRDFIHYFIPREGGICDSSALTGWTFDPPPSPIVDQPHLVSLPPPQVNLSGKSGSEITLRED